MNMSYEEFLNQVDKGESTLLLLTQKGCKHCDTMRDAISELGIPAEETEVTENLKDALKIEVTPTLVVITKNDLVQVKGSKSPAKLKEILSEV